MLETLYGGKLNEYLNYYLKGQLLCSMIELALFFMESILKRLS